MAAGDVKIVGPYLYNDPYIQTALKAVTAVVADSVVTCNLGGGNVVFYVIKAA